MLKDLRLTNFKSFSAETQIVPFAPLTLLVGANGSGKSNIFDAIRFLQGIGLGLSVSEIFAGRWEGGREMHPGIRGGAVEAAYQGTESFAIDATLHTFQRRNVSRGKQRRPLMMRKFGDVNHYIECNMHRLPSVTAERLSVRPKSLNTEDVLFDSHAASLGGQSGVRGGNIRIAYKVAGGSGRRPSADFPNARSIVSQFAIDRAAKMHGDVVSWARAVRRFYSRFRFLDLQPSRMRNYSPISLPELGSSGENLSSILFHICQDDAKKLQIVEWISTLCAPKVTDLDFEQTELGDVLVTLIEDDEREISARSLSDGTLRFLGVLAGLYSAPEDSVFLFEEIENGLHPSRLHLLIELLEQFAEARNLQIIATTHSSQALLALSDDALRNTVLFARDQEHPGTIVRRLGDLPHFEEVTQKTRIDELFTTGWLEFAV